MNKNTKYTLTAIALLLPLFLFGSWAVVSKNFNDRSNWLITSLEKATQKNRLIDSIRVNLLLSAEAEKSAVMADTDEASHDFAEQSAKASLAVEKSRKELEQVLSGEKTPKEQELLSDFGKCWQKLQEIDREILPLAVQNTNLKALKLSFVPASKAIGDMEEALMRVTSLGTSSPNSAQITLLASESLVAALRIYALEALHIAEISDSAMDEMEAVMRRLDEKISESLKGLDGLVDKEGEPYLDSARNSYEEFRRINMQVIKLSRQNSNIRSFAISLGQKRKVMAQCLDTLTALHEAVRDEVTFKATK